MAQLDNHPIDWLHREQLEFREWLDQALSEARHRLGLDREEKANGPPE